MKSLLLLPALFLVACAGTTTTVTEFQDGRKVTTTTQGGIDGQAFAAGAAAATAIAPIIRPTK